MTRISDLDRTNAAFLALRYSESRFTMLFEEFVLRAVEEKKNWEHGSTSDAPVVKMSAAEQRKLIDAYWEMKAIESLQQRYHDDHWFLLQHKRVPEPREAEHLYGLERQNRKIREKRIRWALWVLVSAASIKVLLAPILLGAN